MSNLGDCETKALISIVFAYAKRRVSHDASLEIKFSEVMTNINVNAVIFLSMTSRSRHSKLTKDIFTCPFIDNH